MAVTKMAKRCHAWGVSPSGTGKNQTATAMAMAPRFLGTFTMRCFGAGTWGVLAANSAVLMTVVLPGQLPPAANTMRTRPSRPMDWPCYDPVLVLNQKAPGECIGSGDARVAPCTADEGAVDFDIFGAAFATQFAEGLIAVLIGPDGAAHHPGRSVVEDDRLGTESNSRARWAGEQQGSGECGDRGAPVCTQAEDIAAARGGPCSLELAPLPG